MDVLFLSQKVMMEIKERQLDIIEAAGTLLTRSGVGGLTIKNLAAELEFSEAALYRHFTSKEEIIISMLQYLTSNMDERLTAATEKITDPTTKFRYLFKSQFSFFSQNPHFVVAVFSDGLMDASSRINEKTLQLMEVKGKHLMPILLEGQKTGVFTTELSAKDLLHISIGSFRLQMYKWKADNFEFNIEKRGNGIIDSLLKLLMKK